MNAKKEFIEIVKNYKVKCALISYEASHINSDPFTEGESILKIEYSKKDYESFLQSLNFEYDDGYGGQELFGIIWVEDGTWFSRSEYDGAEGWEYNICPIIDTKLLIKTGKL